MRMYSVLCKIKYHTVFICANTLSPYVKRCPLCFFLAEKSLFVLPLYSFLYCLVIL